MDTSIPCGDIHHLRLTVTDVQRSREFYTGLLGFQVAVESPPPGDPAAAEAYKILFGGVVMMRGNLIMGLRLMAPRRTASTRTGRARTISASASPDALTWSRRSACSTSAA
jgi:glyoxylase I family protein